MVQLQQPVRELFDNFKESVKAFESRDLALIICQNGEIETSKSLLCLYSKVCRRIFEDIVLNDGDINILSLPDFSKTSVEKGISIMKLDWTEEINVCGEVVEFFLQLGINTYSIFDKKQPIQHGVEHVYIENEKELTKMPVTVLLKDQVHSKSDNDTRPLELVPVNSEADSQTKPMLSVAVHKCSFEGCAKKWETKAKNFYIKLHLLSHFGKEFSLHRKAYFKYGKCLKCPDGSASFKNTLMQNKHLHWNHQILSEEVEEKLKLIYIHPQEHLGTADKEVTTENENTDFLNKPIEDHKKANEDTEPKAVEKTEIDAKTENKEVADKVFNDNSQPDRSNVANIEDENRSGNNKFNNVVTPVDDDVDSLLADSGDEEDFQDILMEQNLSDSDDDEEDNDDDIEEDNDDNIHKSIQNKENEDNDMVNSEKAKDDADIPVNDNDQLVEGEDIQNQLLMDQDISDDDDDDDEQDLSDNEDDDGIHNFIEGKDKGEDMDTDKEKDNDDNLLQQHLLDDQDISDDEISDEEL